MKPYYIQEWSDGRYWEKNQDAIVKHTIWRLTKSFDDKIQCDKILVTRAKLEELTKSPQALINKLRKQKVFIDDGNEIILEVNMTKKYCYYCEKWNYREHIVDKRDLEDKSIFEYEVDKHLRTEHHLGYKYENATKIDIPIEDKIYKEWIRDKKPKFEICEHKYKVTSIDNSRLDRLEVELKCSLCGEDETIWRDVTPCQKEI